MTIWRALSAATVAIVTLCIPAGPALARAGCFDRRTEPYTSVVDSHVHLRPFGGQGIPLTEMGDYWRRSGVRYVNLLVINPAVPAKNVAELVAYAKANPGKLNYSAGSTAFQVATEMFKQMTGVDVRHIPYKGSAASITAVIAGDVQMTIVDTPPLVPQIKGGRVRALAVTSAKRAGAMPELPTIAESGVPGYEMVLWIGVFAPAGTPREITGKLNAEVVRVVNLPDIREKLDGMGVEPLGNSSEQVTEWIRREIARFGPVVKAANIKAD